MKNNTLCNFNLPLLLSILFLIALQSSLLAQTFIVENSSAQVARFDGDENTFVSIYEEGVYRGYWGSFAGSAADVDFGTGISNLFGKLHFTIQGNPKLTLNPSGNIGIGTTAPSERLHVSDGNILLSNSPLGVRLNASDRPFITRGFDTFSSGKYDGIGRWGLFMEPSTLTLGIPNIAGKRFEFALYNSDSTLEPVVTIDRGGKVSRPTTGGANLLPICMGSIRWNNGTLTNTPIINGTGNFTLTPYAEGGLVEITIDGEYYNTNGYITHVTCIRDDNFGSGTGRAVVKDSGNGKLQVYTYLEDYRQYSRSFHFVVYKL